MSRMSQADESFKMNCGRLSSDSVNDGMSILYFVYMAVYYDRATAAPGDI
jgi:hypothetical protein